jgi:predicted transcriptional regulator
MSDTGIQRIYRHESTLFTSVPNWVVRDPSYTPNIFRLLAYLLSHADGYELTYQQIERQTTLGRYAINAAAKFLIEVGWLEWERVKGEDGRWLAKKWIIKNPELTSPLSNDSIVEPFHSGTINGHIEEQVKEKNTIREEHSKSLALFEEFYREYPRKKDPGAAKRAFKSALTRASFEDIMAGLIAYKNDPDRDPDFTKYPATWLNSDSWENAAGSGVSPHTERNERERQRSAEFLAEQKKQEALSAPPPKCEHGMTIARCKQCLTSIS